MAVAASLREELGMEPESMWADDGFVIRLPESDRPPDSAALLPSSTSIHDRVTRQLGSTALFAARFRENAARALLLPRRRPASAPHSGSSASVPPTCSTSPRAIPLSPSCWKPTASAFATYSTCLRSPESSAASRAGPSGSLTVDSARPSPFAATLLFGYVANYPYDGDAPLAERRAQAL